MSEPTESPQWSSPQARLGSMLGSVRQKARSMGEAAEKAAESALQARGSSIASVKQTLQSGLRDALEETAPMDVMLREKNARILELEEERASLSAQLKRALAGDALAEALQAVQTHKAEAERVRARAVEKFKAMAAGRAELEAELRALQQRSPATPAAAPGTPAGWEACGLSTPMDDDAGARAAAEMAAAAATAEAAELRAKVEEAEESVGRLKQGIAARDTQLAELREKGRQMLSAKSAEIAEKNAEITVLHGRLEHARQAHAAAVDGAERGAAAAAGGEAALAEATALRSQLADARAAQATTVLLVLLLLSSLSLLLSKPGARVRRRRRPLLRRGRRVSARPPRMSARRRRRGLPTWRRISACSSAR